MHNIKSLFDIERMKFEDDVKFTSCRSRPGHVVVDILEADGVVGGEGSQGEDPDGAKPVENKEVEDAVDDSHNNVKDTDDEGGEEEDLGGLLHAPDNGEVDDDVGGAPDEGPDPVTGAATTCTEQGQYWSA